MGKYNLNNILFYHYLHLYSFLFYNYIIFIRNVTILLCFFCFLGVNCLKGFVIHPLTLVFTDSQTCECL